MMLDRDGKQDDVAVDARRSRALEAIKDSLTIAGILLAGLCALWTFAWEQR